MADAARVSWNDRGDSAGAAGAWDDARGVAAMERSGGHAPCLGFDGDGRMVLDRGDGTGAWAAFSGQAMRGVVQLGYGGDGRLVVLYDPGGQCVSGASLPVLSRAVDALDLPPLPAELACDSVLDALEAASNASGGTVPEADTMPFPELLSIDDDLQQPSVVATATPACR